MGISGTSWHEHQVPGNESVLTGAHIWYIDTTLALCCWSPLLMHGGGQEIEGIHIRAVKCPDILKLIFFLKKYSNYYSHRLA